MLAVAAGACADLTEVNTNPNSPEEVPAKFLLTPAIRNLVSNSVGSMLGTAAIWNQYTAEIQYAGTDIYNQVQSTGISYSGYYTGALMNLDAIIKKEETVNSVQVARILMAYQYHNMTDKWGMIPYSEALQMTADPAITLPKFDTQKDIYYDLFSVLADAQSKLDPAGPKIVEQDLLYKGDIEKWKKFANTLRMRMAMRLSEVDQAKAQAEFVAAYNAGGFSDVKDDAVLWYTTDARTWHPAYDNAQTRDDHAIGAKIVDLLLNGDATGTNYAQHDPRLRIYAERAKSDGAYRGMPAGRAPGHTIDLSSISRLGNRWRGRPDGDAKVMTYSEALFLQAEAALRGWIAADAEDLYNRAIRASMAYYEIPAAEADAYLAAHPEWALTAAGSIPLRQVAIQRWIAAFGNGDEGWFEWRRTGWPELVPGPDNLNNDRVPRRFPYSDTQLNQNPDNLRAAMQAQGMTQGHVDVNARVWWDVKGQ
jgi:hypothetical protein